MKNNTKSSITLPPHELALVNELQKSLKAKSKVEVIRLGLKKLKEDLDRHYLRSEFERAAQLVKDDTREELKALSALDSEGLKNK